jgi:hypothetical protein
MKQTAQGQNLSVWILTDPQIPDLTVWGLSSAERLRRALRAAGVPDEQIGSGPMPQVRPGTDTLVIFRSDHVFDDRLVCTMLTAKDTVLFTSQIAVAVHIATSHLPKALRLLRDGLPQTPDSQHPELRRVTPTDFVSAYTAALRKTDIPYLFRVRRENLVEIESRIFAASYKGITDLVTKWVWPVPARIVTRYLACAGIRPNLVTFVSWLLVGLAMLLFWRGQFGLGLVAAWLMTFLDTVDGKLARVTLTSSKIGHVLDHGLDLLHPPFWYLAWAVGLPVGTPWLELVTFITVGGYVVGRLLEGLFLLAFKFEIHCWQPLDSHFRTITARRNPNLILLSVGTLCGRPDLGLLLVAVWTAFSIAFHTVRLGQACVRQWQGHPVREWQETRASRVAEQEAGGGEAGLRPPIPT